MNTNSSEHLFSNYLQKMQTLKKKNVVRQVLAQELLQEMIESNRDKINEYPLLETQQYSIVKFLTHWGTGYPEHEPILKLLENFINSLNKYEKKLYFNEKDNEYQTLQSTIKNLEILLIKCVQMVIYTQALILDNFSEVLIEYFGEAAQSSLDELLEKMELDENFWKEVHKFFIQDFTNQTYYQIAQNDISISKDSSRLQLFLPFDAIFSYLDQPTEKIEKTRVQSMFDAVEQDEHAKQNAEMVSRYLSQLIEAGDQILKTSTLQLSSRIISLDPAGASCNKAYSHFYGRENNDSLEQNGDNQDQEAISKEYADLVFKQVQIMAYSISLTLKIVKNDFSKALFDIQEKKQARALSLLGSFHLNEIAAALEYLLECQLVIILHQNAKEDAKKISIQSSKAPRVPQQVVESLKELGLSKIGLNKLLEKDSDREAYYLFQPKAPKELQTLLRTLQCEKTLAEEIYKHWKYSEIKTVIIVTIDLEMISKTTSNTTKKLAQLLNRFGIKSTGS